MHRATAGLIAVAHRIERRGFRVGVGAPCHRLALGIGAQILPLEEPQLVVRIEVHVLQSWPALQRHDLHAGLAQLGRKNGACRARAHDDDFGLDLRHDQILRPGFGALCCMPTTGARVKALSLAMSSAV